MAVDAGDLQIPDADGHPVAGPVGEAAEVVEEEAGHGGIGPVGDLVDAHVVEVVNREAAGQHERTVVVVAHREHVSTAVTRCQLNRVGTIDRSLARAHFKAAGRTVNTPWSIAVEGDFVYQGTRKKPIGADLVNWYVEQVIKTGAMILPGMSGSFLLVVMGMYGAVLGAVTDRDLVSLVTFGLGCVVGLAVFSQVLHWALENHYDTVMAVLIGLMLGSLRVLWPWPGGVESTVLSAPGTGGAVLVPVMLTLLGLVVVLGIDWVSHRLEHSDVSDDLEDLVA